MKASTKRRSCAEWFSVVEEQALSGQTIAGFCQSRGIVQATFMYWRKKHQRGIDVTEKHPIQSTSGFIALQPRLGTAGNNILLRGRGGVEVEVPYSTPMNTLQALIHALSC